MDPPLVHGFRTRKLNGSYRKFVCSTPPENIYVILEDSFIVNRTKIFSVLVIGMHELQVFGRLHGLQKLADASSP